MKINAINIYSSAAISLRRLVLFVLFGISSGELACLDDLPFDVSGRTSFFSNYQWPDLDDSIIPDVNDLSILQGSFRLMLEEQSDTSAWSMHAKLRRVHFRHIPNFFDRDALFRYSRAATRWFDQDNEVEQKFWQVQLEQLNYRLKFENSNLTLGRQIINWGSGRLWQAHNIFGAFSPTEIDTDFKPAIDAINWQYFPSPFSQIQLVYLPTKSNAEAQENFALYGQSALDAGVQLTYLAGRTLDTTTAGFGVEGDWRGLGYHIEASYYRGSSQTDTAWFWVIGADYQFDSELLLSLEWHDNALNPDNYFDWQERLASASPLQLVQFHRVRRVMGVSLSKPLTPLLNVNYLALLAFLDNKDSSVHQVTFQYSLSNEADVLFNLATGLGPKTNMLGPQSEFGDVADQISITIRHYL